MKNRLYIVGLVAFIWQAHSLWATNNDEIFDYIGSPIHYQHPDKRFQGEALYLAFTKAAVKSGVELMGLKVDDSEYPPLLYGRLKTMKSQPGGMQSICRQLEKPYAYAGSVTSAEYFCVDIISSRDHPRELLGKIFRRNIRKAVLQNKAKELFSDYLIELNGQKVHADTAYRGPAVKAAFEKACAKEKVKLLSLYVDDSEFPPLLYGKASVKLDEPNYIQELCASLGRDYAYAGSLLSGAHFCLDIVPHGSRPMEMKGKTKALAERMKGLITKALQEK